MAQSLPEDSFPTPRSDSAPDSTSAISPIQLTAYHGPVTDQAEGSGSSQAGQSNQHHGKGGHVRSATASSDEEDSEEQQGSGPKKKHRITLPRGRACVACRTRKLRCTGTNPCGICEKNGIHCRYEEIQRRKPRAVMLEERVAQLEGMLLARGETLPPTKLKRKISITNVEPSIPPEPTSLTPVGDDNRTSISQEAPRTPPSSTGQRGSDSASASDPPLPIEIPPHSPLEQTLINVVLPHTPYLLMPVHPQRFLALLSLPASDPGRPHPALLYIMFADAVRILETDTPTKPLPPPPRSIFPTTYTPPMPPYNPNDKWVLQHVTGMSETFLERARVELDRGMRNVDRLFDLCRATVGIARHLISLGRFIEGYTIPVSRLLISCGLHRQTGVIVPPDGMTSAPGDPMPRPYSSPYHYRQSYAFTETSSGHPVLRMRPVVLPPPRDEIELAERVMTFWAVKYQEWEMSIGWGWSLSLADEECTTMWPWGWGSAEIRPPAWGPYGIADLYDPHSPMHSSPVPDTTFTLAVKSVGLLQRANHLFDLPISNHVDPRTRRPSHVPPLSAVQQVATALQLFRERIPIPFRDFVPSYAMDPSEVYDGPQDPWWVAMHANLLLAEIMMWKEMAHHKRSAYDQAVSCARAMVTLVKRLRPESYVHMPLVVSLDISLAARFLNKESSRLSSLGHPQPAAEAAQEAEYLRSTLANDMAKWVPMASLHAMIVQRVKEGWPEKEGEYERV
ncbi:hypothetical protein BD324DRAFT_514442 [Kockovaella imperatae]|uniref:Zn(2)-C6 fungal-type domain-containing protein n=1 Tax=Kockovaella imperatae TaxID=4999 RepID=A0A1Y1UEN2_9TREE|nr:hypothetical protein BD324DRAFT_514442 [Kockovaella imperatae]ORX35974.1 hypothetical protein BD324DRAFT_514442 [Kockovaella imperatae]